MLNRISFLNRISLLAVGCALLMASCGTKKKVVDGTDGTTTATTTLQQQDNSQNVTFLKSLVDGQVTAKNIVGSMSFRIKINGENFKVPGSLHMRRNEMIRIQLFIPLLGSEVGRLEFTPKGVLMVDRMHKEYIEATYSELDFLKNNGLDFYSLQALFWNHLALPGVKSVTKNDLTKFTVNDDGQANAVTIGYEQGRMKLQWNADKQTAHIVAVKVNYASDSHGASSLVWNYDKFVSVGNSMYPSKQDISFVTTATGSKKTVNVSVEMDEVKTSSKWDLQTKLSNKYTKVDAKELMKKLFKL